MPYPELAGELLKSGYYPLVMQAHRYLAINRGGLSSGPFFYVLSEPLARQERAKDKTKIYIWETTE